MTSFKNSRLLCSVAAWALAAGLVQAPVAQAADATEATPRKATRPTTRPAKPRGPVSEGGIALPRFGGPAAAPLPGGLSLPGGIEGRAAGEDYIVAVVDKELVTRSELDTRIERIQADAARRGASLPEGADLQREVLELLISERAQLVSARDSGIRVDAAELDRAVKTVASQNQLSVAQLAQRLRSEGMDMARLREQLRDQILVERVREREIAARVKISDAEVDALAEKMARGEAEPPQLDIAHLLVPLPENASEAQAKEAARTADALLARARAGASFESLAQDPPRGVKLGGGDLGLRPLDRLPEAFVAAVRNLQPGEVAPQWLRSDAGIHLIRLVERRGGAAPTLAQTHVRHILLRIGPNLSQDAAVQQLARYKRDIEGGKASFATVAREHSQDGSAQAGGELGWAEPGLFVPEFEQAMNALAPGQISDPVVSRFGVHLIQVQERRRQPMTPAQIRDAARNALRERKSEQAFLEWVQEVRARAYVERR